VVTPIDPTAGMFRFTRLDPAATGLSYEVYTSTDLKTWTMDAGATQTVVSSSGNVHTVQVTPSGVKPLAATKLFVRVAAH
jgi:hypothetical protein